MENRYKDSPGITEETKRLLKEQFLKDADEEVSFNRLMDTVFIEAQSADEVAEALTGLCEQDLVAVWSSIGEQAYEDDRPPVSYLEKICRSNPASAAWNIAKEFGRDAAVWWFFGKTTRWSRTGNNRMARSLAGAARKYILTADKQQKAMG